MPEQIATHTHIESYMFNWLYTWMGIFLCLSEEFLVDGKHKNKTKPSFVAFAYFHGVNTPTVAYFQPQCDITEHRGNAQSYSISPHRFSHKSPQEHR